MVTFLFWNLNRKPLHSLITTLVVQHQIDVLIFAECSIEPNVLEKNLSDSNVKFYHLPSARCRMIDIYTRFRPEFIATIRESERLTIRQIKQPETTDILLAAIHLPSKLHWDNASQSFMCAELEKHIRLAENKVGHSRTILVGDLNMNPFEDGLVMANALHAVMDRAIAEKGSRVVQGKKYQFFYNPMWNFFGDASQGPPGTYYYGQSTLKTFFWNMFDQVFPQGDAKHSNSS
jgi:hypothetical protein